jgi:hypothetical protein
MTGKVLGACKRRRPQQNAPVVGQLRERFRITHPFHPRRGEEFELIRYHRSWGVTEHPNPATEEHLKAGHFG